MDEADTSPPPRLLHLSLRGVRADALVLDEADWRALALIAERTLFWCGGAIHGCRCEGNDMHFAVEPRRTSIGSVASHLTVAYSSHVRRRRRWKNGVFRRYRAVALDMADLDDLVIWLHRPASVGQRVWTTDASYHPPYTSTWVTTRQVLGSVSGVGAMIYRWRLTQPIDPALVSALTRRRTRRMRRSFAICCEAPPDIEKIARVVAEHTHISYDDMCSASRKRMIGRAKVIAAVLCTRRGASAAAVARLFRRSRSTLIEQTEHYRKTEPQLFRDAERFLNESLSTESTHNSSRLKPALRNIAAGIAVGVLP